MDMNIKTITNENGKSSVIISYRGMKFQINQAVEGYTAGLLSYDGVIHIIRNAPTPLEALKAAIKAQIDQQLLMYRALADCLDNVRLIKNWDYVFSDLEGAHKNVNSNMD